MLSHSALCQTLVTLWTIAHQSHLSMEFSRQEYWSGCHFLFQGIFPTQGSNLQLLHCKQFLYHMSHLLLLLLSRFSLSDSVRPHRQQPTRLPHPWDSPGKNAGVGCHFLLQCMKVKSESEVAQLSPTLSDPMDCSPPGSSVHGIFQARVLEWVAIAFLGSPL